MWIARNPLLQLALYVALLKFGAMGTVGSGGEEHLHVVNTIDSCCPEINLEKESVISMKVICGDGGRKGAESIPRNH